MLTVNATPKQLLIIDDDSIFRLGLVTALQAYPDLENISQSTLKNAPTLLKQLRPDLILLDPGLSGWSLCQSILDNYPDIPLCLLTITIDLNKLQSLKRRNNLNYCPKGISVDRLVTIVRQLLAGGKYWSASKRFSPRHQWLIHWRQYGLQQIEDNLESLGQYLDSNLVDRFFWQGRKRELLAARWLVNQLLPVAVLVVPQEEVENSQLSTLLLPSSQRRSIYDNIFLKLQSPVHNSTSFILEIDILNENKRRELLYLILEKIKKVVEEIKLFKIDLDEAIRKKDNILQILWEESTVSFLKRSIGLKEKPLIDEIISNDLETIQTFILAKIPSVIELFKELVNPDQMEEKTKEIILENLMIHLGNAVMSDVLNNLSESEEIKRELYDSKLMSSREIARFRNLLGWRYKQDKYWDNPQDIFECQYRFFYLEEGEIKITYLYASRQEELDRLQGIAWLVTIVLEIRDATSPRFRSLIGWLGNGLIYILTEVIGKGIGLIGRGVIKGIGNALQDTRKKP